MPATEHHDTQAGGLVCIDQVAPSSRISRTRDVYDDETGFDQYRVIPQIAEVLSRKRTSNHMDDDSLPAIATTTIKVQRQSFKSITRVPAGSQHSAKKATSSTERKMNGVHASVANQQQNQKLEQVSFTVPAKLEKVTSTSRSDTKKEVKSDCKKKAKKEATRMPWSSSRDRQLGKAKLIKIEPSTPKKVKTEKKAAEEEDVWRWWEETDHGDGRKWTTLAHNGPVFASAYQPLPADVKFYYNGEPVRLGQAAEEVMTFYAAILDHEYTSKELFNNNFTRDWRKYMTNQERDMIIDLAKCDFREVHAHFEKKKVERKAMSKEEKKAIKLANEEIKKIYGFCYWDNHRQPIGNYRIEPPGLFRGRGEHPKQGCVKKRIQPEDVTINCDSVTKAPLAPEGHRWKEVRHDTGVSWLATWVENIMGNNKYVMLNPSARVKAERDWHKYEKARKLHKIIERIRSEYQEEWKSKEMRLRQRAVALYFIDKLALRVGNEKDSDEADTVGCCSLRCEHIKLHAKMDGIGENVVEFDFLGKDSIRYHNCVPVKIRVFKNLKLFLENKTSGDDLFDRVSTTSLNQYLTDLMPGLTAKVFRTYNASRTLQEQLEILTIDKDPTAAKLLSYNRANRQVAILCNHQRSVPKTFGESMEKLNGKIEVKKRAVKEIKKECKKLESDYKNTHSMQAKKELEKRKNLLDRAKEQLTKLQIQATDKEENKQIALSTSKLNYLDPRITVAWCNRNDVPIEKVYSKTQRQKFMWAIHMTNDSFHFHNYEGEIQLKNVEEDSNSSKDDEDDGFDANGNADNGGRQETKSSRVKSEPRNGCRKQF